MERDERPVKDKGMEPVSALLPKYISCSEVNVPKSDGMDATKLLEFTEKCVKDVDVAIFNGIDPVSLLL